MGDIEPTKNKPGSATLRCNLSRALQLRMRALAPYSLVVRPLRLIYIVSRPLVSMPTVKAFHRLLLGVAYSVPLPAGLQPRVSHDRRGSSQHQQLAGVSRRCQHAVNCWAALVLCSLLLYLVLNRSICSGGYAKVKSALIFCIGRTRLKCDVPFSLFYFTAHPSRPGPEARRHRKQQECQPPSYIHTSRPR